MGEIILSQIGAAAGASLLPGGINILGQTFSGAAIGQAIGGLAGRAIDASMLSPREGPRIKALQIMESREGASLPIVYGRMRVGGQVIWASKFKEKRSEQSAGKGGPKYVNYTYSVSFAVALCQGPIARVDRVWANGEPFDLSSFNWRLYPGDKAQMPDPLIEAIEGSGNAPAHRGTAYIVFEDLPLDAFGNRLPQLSFEVVRTGDSARSGLARAVEGINIIPASGEFVYATSIVRERRFPGIENALNRNNVHGEADFQVSLEQLQTDLPNVKAAALTVGWFGDDLRAGDCSIRPGVEQRDRTTVPYAWTVDQTDRGTAYLISRTDESPNYGGTPADAAVLEGIEALKSAGIAVTLSPFLFMDVPPGNSLPDPYGAGEQAAFPWRGRIMVSADRTRAARTEIDAFVGADRAYGFRHFILHHARLAARAGGVDAFLIGSEMSALTRVRDDQGRFPFVEALGEIAVEVKAIVGPSVKVSYAADWTEYGAYASSDGSNDVLFPLDELWASDAIDFVGVDWYPPSGDWRDDLDHLDAIAGVEAADSAAYITANLEGGEAFDWYYANAEDRDAQVRTPIVDTAHGEHWVFRAKDLQSWWENEHYSRPGGDRADQPSRWRPTSKPIRMIEIGFPAVDKGTNAPNVFYDPKSSESAFPAYSNGIRDDLLQRRALTVAAPYWAGKSAVEQVLVWAWDGRPWPDFPARTDVWSDGPNWQYGHWLNGRSGLMELSEVLEDLADAADVEIDTRRVNSVVDGFAIDGVTSLASAIAPLIAAFNFDVRESETGLIASDEVAFVQLDLAAETLVEGGEFETVALLDKQPSGVSLSYISGDFLYQPALVTQRYPGADLSFVVQTSLPLVLTETQARWIAEDQFQRTQITGTSQLTLGPGVSAQLEIADLISFKGEPWRIERIEENGLEKLIHMRAKPTASVLNKAINPPEAGDLVLAAADPEFVLIDGPTRSTGSEAGVLVAATSTPWTAPLPIQIGVTGTSLSVVAIVDQPAGLGILETDASKGPLGRWDDAAVLDVYLPGQDLASADDDAVLSGGNRLLIQNDAGWELIGWRSAELAGEDRWHLSGLIRGLSGTPVRELKAGALVVLVDDRLVNVPLSSETLGLSLLWQVGETDPRASTFQDRASRPFRVGHLRSEKHGDTFELSWTARGVQYADNWTLPDDITDGRYRIESFLDGELQMYAEQTETALTVRIGGATEIRVAEIGSHQQLGEWVSILLPQP